ncbi:MAG: hypothetical protein AMXMBFR59_12830 [Rhodanobacteraceae bacterium]
MKFLPKRPSGLRFCSDAPAIDIELMPDENGDAGVRCKAKCSIPTSDEVWAFVDAYISGTHLQGLKPGIELPLIEDGVEKIDKEGRIKEHFRLPRRLLPDAVQSLLATADDRLKQSISRFVRTLRWRQDVDGPAQPFWEKPSLYWRTKEGPFRIAPPSPIRVSLPMRTGIIWDEESQAALRQAWESGANEPLCYELLREARELVDTAERSALLIGFSALEVGIKHHLSAVAPSASWFFFNAPSPPVSKILKTYLPELHSGAMDPNGWKKLPSVKDCAERDQERNAVAHRGVLANPGGISEFLESVNEVLYLLEALRGNAWARDYIPTATQRSLGWPGKGLKRAKITISQHC